MATSIDIISPHGQSPDDLTPLNLPKLYPSDHFLEGEPEKPLYPMTNDYMFRAVLQECNDVLKALICAVLHLDPETVYSVTINNPILLGTVLDKKEFRLDINVTMNNHACINLEMQVANEPYWKERSLQYLCRMFSNFLSHGEIYAVSAPAIHIGFIDFDLEGLGAHFHYSNKMVDVRNLEDDLQATGSPAIYYDSFQLDVINLRRINLADEDDKLHKVDQWAALFKSSTWDEIKRIAEGSPVMIETANAIRAMNEEDRIRARCEDRLEYDKLMRTIDYEREQLTSENASLKAEMALLKARIAALESGQHEN